MDRGGGAAPALNRPDEVLGRADRHRRIEPERGAGGVGARVGLIPLGPLHERDRLRPPQHAGRAGHPQQLPLLVRHRHDGVALLRRLAEHVRQQREDLRQRVLGPVLPQHAPVQGDGRVAGIGLDPGGDRAQPRIRDDLPDPRGYALLDEAGVRVAHGHRASQSGHAPSEPRREAMRLPSRPAGPASRDDDHRVVDVPLQGGRDRADDVVVSVLGAADDEEHLGVGPVPIAQVVRDRDQVVRDRAVAALEVPALGGRAQVRGLQAGADFLRLARGWCRRSSAAGRPRPRRPGRPRPRPGGARRTRSPCRRAGRSAAGRPCPGRAATRPTRRSRRPRRSPGPTVREWSPRSALG